MFRRCLCTSRRLLQRDSGMTFGQKLAKASADADAETGNSLIEKITGGKFTEAGDGPPSIGLSTAKEQESFRRAFDFLEKDANDSEIRITPTLFRMAGIEPPEGARVQSLEEQGQEQEQDESESSRSRRVFDFIGTVNDSRDRYKHSYEQTSELRTALKPTLQHINESLQTSEQLAEFARKICETFVASDKNWDRASTLEKIHQQSTATPWEPLVNRQTLPVLLKFCVDSLCDGFGALDEALLLTRFIKRHPSISLYEVGMDISVYNSLLKHVWEKTQNVQLIAQLAREMRVNAIIPDMLTYKHLSTVYLKCMSVKEDGTCKPNLLWGDKADVYRIRAVIMRLRPSQGLYA